MAIHAIDHLGEVVGKNGKGSCLQDLKLHRTKCRSLLMKVIAPTFKDQLKQDLSGQKYALLVYEATDPPVDKNLCLCVRYSNVGNVKTKLRNRMSLNLLDVILRIRTTLILGKGGCCKSLEVTKEMLAG